MRRATFAASRFAADLREDQHELVAAKARDRLLSTCFRQATDLPSEKIASLRRTQLTSRLATSWSRRSPMFLAECIVYAELVEIDEQHGKTALMTLRGRQGAPEARASAPDWEPGQTVEVRERTDCLFGPSLFGDVDPAADHFLACRYRRASTLRDRISNGKLPSAWRKRYSRAISPTLAAASDREKRGKILAVDSAEPEIRFGEKRRCSRTAQ